MMKKIVALVNLLLCAAFAVAQSISLGGGAVVGAGAGNGAQINVSNTFIAPQSFTAGVSATTLNAGTSNGVVSPSICSLSGAPSWCPGGTDPCASAAAAVATTYVASVSAGTVVVNHTATTGMTYNVQCTPQ